MISERISDDTTSPNEYFEYGYPHSNALLQSHPKLECSKPHKAACQPTKCDVVNEVKLFPTVYCRIYYRKFLTLSNQKLHYKGKCIRMHVLYKSLEFFSTFKGRFNFKSPLY